MATPLGTLMLVSLPVVPMKIVISALVIAMVALLVRGWHLDGPVRRGVLLGAGVAGGLVQGVAGISGPPVVAVALSRAGAPRQQRANVLGVMTAISLASIIPFWYYGLLTAKALWISLLLFPVNFCATWLGSRYFFHPRPGPLPQRGAGGPGRGGRHHPGLRGARLPGTLTAARDRPPAGRWPAPRGARHAPAIHWPLRPHCLAASVPDTVSDTAMPHR